MQDALSAPEALPARDLLVEPDASDVPAELVAPEFLVAERAELTGNDSLGEAQASRVTHDSETPPAPSVRSFSEPEIASAPTGDVAASPASEASAPHDAETVAPSAIAPEFHGATPNGIANGVAFASVHAAHAAASAPTPVETDVPPVSDAALAAAAPEPQIHTPGLILIEAERSERYLYWELSATDSPCWLHIVSHTPTARGHAERRERRFPVQQRRGAVCIQGLPASAVLRAKLSQEPDGKPIVVAGAVRTRDAAFEVRFSPHPHAALDAIAERARPALQRATPVYWDT